MHRLGSSLNIIYQHNTLPLNNHGIHVFLMGEQDVLASPLIFNAKIASQINNNEISSLILSYLLPLSLSTNEYANDVSMNSNISLTLIESSPS